VLKTVDKPEYLSPPFEGGAGHLSAVALAEEDEVPGWFASIGI